jgi:Gas vesicle synthesis protein GvpL/GvpF
LSATGVYVYGVAPADAAPPEGATGVDPGFPVELVRDGGLAAIASRVDLAEFGADALAERARELEWVAPRALAHESVLERALAGGRPLLPFRFGTIYLDADHVTALLRERSRELSNALERVRGRVELGVRGAVDQRAIEVFATSRDPELQRLADEVTGASSGAAYLRGKQLERRLAEAVEREAAHLAAQVHDTLAAEAADARRNAPRPDEDGALIAILNGAYLVEQSAQAPFAAEVDRLAAEQAETGLVLETTGPWPPYNFVPEELTP